MIEDVRAALLGDREAAKADVAAAEQARAKMEEDMKLLNVRLAGAQEDREQAAQAVARLEAQLAELKEQPVEVAVETVVDQAAIDKARAEKKAALGADKDVAQFEVLFDQGKDLANKMRGMLLKARGREDQAAAQGMAKALRALAEAIGRCAE